MLTGGWMVATDARQVHALVESSDRVAAAESGTTAPIRNFASTEQLVQGGQCQVFADEDGRYLATVSTGPWDSAAGEVAAGETVWYMRRLAVTPELRESGQWLGAQAVLHVCDVAADAGADLVRCEVNPRLTRVLDLLAAAGFEPVPGVAFDREADVGQLQWRRPW